MQQDWIETKKTGENLRFLTIWKGAKSDYFFFFPGFDHAGKISNEDRIVRTA